MRKIHKYQIDLAKPKVAMPINAKVLSAGAQRGALCVWAEVDDTEVTEEVLFEVFGTGQEISEFVSYSREYVGTAFFDDGNVVLHVYKILKWPTK